MFSKRAICFTLAVAGFVLGCGGDMFATIPGCSGVTPPTIEVQNGSLMENGQPFVLRGLQIRGFVAALQVDNDNASVAGSGNAWATDAAAQGAYGDAELNAASSWNANAIRIQVSQPSLDPQNTENDLMFEIYNEPTLTDAGYSWPTCSAGTPSTMNWRSWAHAGETTYDNNYGNPNGWVGMQNMLNYMRANGATSNVLIMDGIKLAAELDGIPGLFRGVLLPKEYNTPSSHLSRGPLCVAGQFSYSSSKASAE